MVLTLTFQGKFVPIALRNMAESVDEFEFKNFVTTDGAINLRECILAVRRLSELEVPIMEIADDIRKIREQLLRDLVNAIDSNAGIMIQKDKYILDKEMEKFGR